MHTLARVCVQRPVFATVLSLTLFVVGLVGYLQLGVDRFPKVDIPIVTVSTPLRGSTPEEIETEITDKIERQVNTVSGIDSLASTSSDGLSVVTITFELSKDVNVAAEEVRAKVALARADLPPDADQSVVMKIDTQATPVVSYVVSSPGGVRDTYEYVDKVLRRRLESVSGVGEVQVIGGRSRQINITVDPYRLRSYGLTPTDVTSALTKQNTQVPGGLVEQGATQLTLRTQGRVQKVSDFEKLPVKTFGTQQILLRDVAAAEDGASRATTVASVDGREAVVMQVIKQSDANAVAVIDAVKDRMKELETSVPVGFHVDLYRDQSTYINASLSAVREHLILGSLLAALVVFIFLNSSGLTLGAWAGIGIAGAFTFFMMHTYGLTGALIAAIAIFFLLLWIPAARPTLISALAIPTSIIATFGLMKAFGFTQNNVTLLALTLSVGIVIDDAIVVLENVFRVIEEEGNTPYQAAIKATREIGLAVLAITLSLVMVFLPVAFMGGIVGRFMNSFGVTMACAVAVSMFVSFSLTPMLCSRWLRSAEPGDEHGGHAGAAAAQAGGSKGGWFGRMEDAYGALLHWSIRYWPVILLGCGVVLFSIVPLGKMARKNFLPDDDESQFQILVRAPEGTSLDGTRAILDRMAADAVKLPEVKQAVVTVGSDPAQTANLGTVYVKLNEVEDRHDQKVTQFTDMEAARKTILPKFQDRGLTMSVQKISTFGSGSNAAIQLAITGPELTKLAEYSDRLVAAAKRIPGVADADSTLYTGKPELQVRIDRERAAMLGADVQAVAQAMRLAVAGDDKITAFDDAGEQYEVHIRLDEKYRQDATSLALLSVPTDLDGKKDTITVDQVVKFVQTTGPASIDRFNRQRQFMLRVNLLPTASQGAVTAVITDEINALHMPAGYRLNAAGMSKEFAKTFLNFAFAGLLSFAFMYLVIAAQFESFVHAIVIMITLPLTFPFAVLSIVLTGDSLNIFSMLGMLVLLGVVKKNAILQIDRANQLRGAGMDLVTATVQASKDRLRPILMTTLAFVAGMLPLVVSKGTGAATNHTTGGVIVGGQVFSLLLTLVAAPVFYVLLDTAANSDLFRLVRRVVSRNAGGEQQLPGHDVWGGDGEWAEGDAE